MERDDCSNFVSAFSLGYYESHRVLVSVIHHLLSSKPNLDILVTFNYIISFFDTYIFYWNQFFFFSVTQQFTKENSLKLESQNFS